MWNYTEHSCVTMELCGTIQNTVVLPWSYVEPYRTQLCYHGVMWNHTEHSCATMELCWTIQNTIVTMKLCWTIQNTVVTMELCLTIQNTVVTMELCLTIQNTVVTMELCGTTQNTVVLPWSLWWWCSGAWTPCEGPPPLTWQGFPASSSRWTWPSCLCYTPCTLWWK